MSFSFRRYCFLSPLSASGGNGPYEFSNSADFNTIIGNFTTSITFDVAQGTYQYFVRDANGCISNVSNEITIDPLPELSINLASENPTINCAGDNTAFQRPCGGAIFQQGHV